MGRRLVPKGGFVARDRDNTVSVTMTRDGEIRIYTNPKIPDLKRIRGEDGKKIEPVVPQVLTERRAHPRHMVQVDITVSCAGLIHKCKSVDLSLGGVRLTSMIPDSFLGKTLEVLISDPTPFAGKSKKMVSVRGKATTQRLCETLRFEKLDVTTANRIENIIAFMRVGPT